MFGCPDCQCACLTKSRIYHDVVSECFRSQSGTCLACSKLLALNPKIEDTRRVLISLLQARKNLAGTLNEHHDPFVNRVPVEIASRIFVQLKPFNPLVHTSDERYKEEEVINSVFTPGRICQNWRQISRNTPQLWTTLCTTVTKRNSVASVPFVREWLQRSKALPLCIQLDLHITSSDQTAMAFAEKIISAVVHHAHCWEVLDLDIPYTLLRYISLAISGKTLDRLQHLKLDFGYDDSDSDRRTPADVLHLQPFPKRLTHWGGWWLEHCSTNWEYATHLISHVARISQIVAIFQRAPHLSFCKFLGPDADPDDEDDPATETLEYPSLQTLVIEKTDPTALNLFWERFSFPSLVSLNIPYARQYTHLQNCLRRSGCRLLELTLKDGRGIGGGIIKTLKLVPDLERLSLEGTVLDRPFFSQMDKSAVLTSGEQPEFFRKLKSLSCATSSSDFDWEGLLAFLTTMKCRQEATLEFLEFRYTGRDFAPYPKFLLDQELAGHILDATHGLKFRMVNAEGRDILGTLRHLHNS